MLQCLAIIPARGGSKDLPRKNILPIAGKPLLGWSIEAARSAKNVNRVVISIDDSKIAQVAERYGADVVWRPAELSGDLASSESALLHALEHLDRTEGYQPDLLVFLQCTSPMTLAADIDGTVDRLVKEEADTALSVIDFHHFIWQNDPSGDAIGVNHDKLVRLLRQNLPLQYLETGAVYVTRVQGFLEHKHRFFGRTAKYLMPAERRWEIDNPVDFQVAEVLLRQQHRLA